MLLSRFPNNGFAAPRLQIFVSDLGATGVVRNAVAIANHAAASGYEVRLLTCTANGVLRSEIDKRVVLIELLGGESKAESRRSQLKRTFLAYRRHSRDWRPDILLSAGNHGHLLSTFAWLGLKGKKLLRISNDLRHRKPSPPARLWRNLKFKLITLLADRLVLVSRAQCESPLLSRMVSTGKAVVIPNGVDIDAVQSASRRPCPHPWTADRSVPIVLAVGRHVKQKNFHILLKAFACARRERKIRLIMLGDGQAGETVRLHNLAIGLGIGADVAFVPSTSNPFPFMAASHALALPSLWEGSSNVLLEAMACEIPIIASHTAGDARQLLSDGKYGILVDPTDEQGLARAILKQTGTDPVCPDGRALAFNRAVAIEDYLRLFRQCIATMERTVPHATQRLRPLAAKSGPRKAA